MCGAGFNAAARTGVGEVVGHGVVLRVVLELLGRDGGAEEVLEVLEHILLAWRKGFWLGVRVEIGHGAGAAEATGLTWERTNESVHKLAGRWRPPYHPVAFFCL